MVMLVSDGRLTFRSGLNKQNAFGAGPLSKCTTVCHCFLHLRRNVETPHEMVTDSLQPAENFLYSVNYTHLIVSPVFSAAKVKKEDLPAPRDPLSATPQAQEHSS